MSPLDRHQKIALQLSGGKDSVACLYFMREHLHRITVYNMDAGDDPPETRQIIEECKKIIPHFVQVNGDVEKWREEYGFPSDVVPTSATYLGMVAGFGKEKLSDRFACCYANVMQPMHKRMLDDGITLIIRGVKSCDMPTLPKRSGDSMGGVELYYPLQDWTDADVFSYLREVGAPIHPVYSKCKEGVGCMHCTAWWDYKLVDWLKDSHPKAHEIVVRKHIVIRQVIASQMRGLNA